MKITADVLAGNHRLKAIVRAGVGTDNIDKEAATRLGIVVMNTPAGNTLSTAEHTWALMLGLSRNVAPAYHSLIEHKWDRNKYMGTQLADKVLGIVGLGRIGQAVAKRAKAFEMRVLGFDPFLSKSEPQEMGVEPIDSIRELLPKVDYLTVHTPLTDETNGIVNHETLPLLKPGVRLINCARGGIYDEAALVEGLKNGKIAGVALDVYAGGAVYRQSTIRHAGRTVHAAFGGEHRRSASPSGRRRRGLAGRFSYDRRYSPRGEHESAGSENAGKPARASECGASAGRLLLRNLLRGVPKRCEISYRGEVAGKNTKLLNAAFACGLLESALVEDVNIVNAEVLLRERGIELVEQSRHDRGDFNSVISATIDCRQRKSPRRWHVIRQQHAAAGAD